MTDRLSPHFTRAEFEASDTAQRLGIDNTIPADMLTTARATAQMMERIRAYLCYLKANDVPVQITSGYRCQALNRAMGSKDSSDHPKALAVDFKAPEFGTPYEVCVSLAPVLERLGIGQIIYEFTWVHVSSRTPSNPVNRILTKQGKGYVPGIQKP